MAAAAVLDAAAGLRLIFFSKCLEGTRLVAAAVEAVEAVAVPEFVEAKTSCTV